MTDGAWCEATTEEEIIDVYGQARPSQWKPCRQPARYSVTRQFTGIKQALCDDHARWFKDRAFIRGRYLIKVRS